MEPHFKPNVNTSADLTPLVESAANWLSLIPDGARALGERAMDALDHKMELNRIANIEAALAQAVPHLEENAQKPDDDFLAEWFNLTGKRSKQEWQLALGKMLAREANAPGSVPLRYFVDMARLDHQVMEEFVKYCAWYVNHIKALFVPLPLFPQTPRYIEEANLVHYSPTTIKLLQTKRQNSAGIVIPLGGDRIILRNEEHHLPIGKYQTTRFGDLVYSLLDPLPPSHPQLAAHLRSLWKDHLHEADADPSIEPR